MFWRHRKENSKEIAKKFHLAESGDGDYNDHGMKPPFIPPKAWYVWLLPLALALAIFCFSAQPADDSSKTSDGVTMLLLNWSDQLTPGDMTQQEKLELCEKLSYPVRKTAHITEYAVFYLTLLFALHNWQVRGSRLPTTALCMTFLYACTDEFHQLFVPGRSGAFTDVLIDSSGAAVLTVCLILWARRGRNKMRT